MKLIHSLRSFIMEMLDILLVVLIGIQVELVGFLIGILVELLKFLKMKLSPNAHIVKC